MSRRPEQANRSAVSGDPRYQALVREAVAATLARDNATAERAARMLLQANPREHVAWNALAIAALRGGRAAAAIEAAERAHQLDRKNPDYLNTLGAAYGDLGRCEEAIAAFRRAIKTRPAFADAHYNLGKMHERQDRLTEAVDAYRRALLVEPRHADAKHNLARVLLLRGELEPALALAREAHADLPDDEERTVNLVRALADAQGVRTAVEFLMQRLRQFPQSARLHSLAATLLLSLGEWQAGWREYLWRPNTNRASTGSVQPIPGDLGGNAIRLVADQGLGDMLFFLRFAPAVRARAAKVIFRPPAKLQPILAGHPGLDLDSSPEAELPPDMVVVDSVRLGDLPFVLGTEDVPPPLPLRAPEHLVREWREQLGALGPAPYVGVTWRAGTDARAISEFVLRTEILFKRIPLPLLGGALGAARGTLVSIQRFPAAGEVQELARVAGKPVHDLAAVNDNLERMTALLAVLDDYIGVSNTNMHLRAGVGLTAKVLVPYPPEFRWMTEGAGSPWFPGFSVYRQGVDRGWDDALTRLAADLRAI